MQALLVKLALKLLTEQFASKAIVIACRQAAKSTENTMDNDLVEAVATALGVK